MYSNVLILSKANVLPLNSSNVYVLSNNNNHKVQHLIKSNVLFPKQQQYILVSEQLKFIAFEQQLQRFDF